MEPIEVLRSAGLRVTQPRRAVLEAFRAGGGHLRADEVHRLVARGLPGVALPTVYAVLADLVRAGVVRQIDRDGAAAVYDSTRARHHHLLCRSCGALVDVPCEEVDEHGLCLERPVAARGWALDAADVTFRGTCPTCRRGGAAGVRGARTEARGRKR